MLASRTCTLLSFIPLNVIVGPFYRTGKLTHRPGQSSTSKIRTSHERGRVKPQMEVKYLVPQPPGPGTLLVKFPQLTAAYGR